MISSQHLRHDRSNNFVFKHRPAIKRFKLKDSLAVEGMTMEHMTESKNIDSYRLLDQMALIVHFIN